MVNYQEEIHVAFALGKARVAPIKSVSVPKLELTAAVVSVRLKQLVRRELNLPNCKSMFWNDSTAVLQSIKNSTKRFSIFVANRLAIIDEHTTVDQWHYVPSKSNPADFSSRPVAAAKLSYSHEWLCGPPFLLQSKSAWPEPPVLLPELPCEFLSSKTEPV